MKTFFDGKPYQAFQSSYDMCSSMVSLIVCRILLATYKPFAGWRYFTTTTRILFVCPFIFKFSNPSEEPKFAQESKPLKDSGRSSKMTSSCKWPIASHEGVLLARHAILPDVHEEGTLDEPLRTSAREANRSNRGSTTVCFWENTFGSCAQGWGRCTLITYL